MNRELFLKYIQNRCSAEELQEVIDWFNGEAGMIHGRSFLYEFWSEMTDDNTEMGEGEINQLNRIHHDLNILETEKLLQRTKHQPLRFQKRKKLFQSLLKVAAVLFIPLLAVSLYFNISGGSIQGNLKKSKTSWTKVFSPVGSISQISLPDGTLVYLNHNSTLEYPVIFNKKARQVKLSGEAYFRVKHNADIPFIVTTGDLNVVATGTEFNIMAFPGLKRIETTLVSGKVMLQKKDANGIYKTLVSMMPNEMATYDTDENKIEYGQVNIDKYTMWKEGKLMFENDPLDKVAERLGMFYNVEIILSDAILKEYTYTATFEDETLYQVMELLKLATPVDFTIKSRKKMDDGTYSKKKVYITFKGKK